ncbi:hypothetical protein M0Q50_05195 [bacterium]|jgi:hypothetical protein|nr:hypothetical protein [bacterium]
MKVGDKLVCKKTYNFYGGELFTKGDTYILDEISMLGIDLINNHEEWTTFNDDERYPDYIWEYFYSPEEIRKIKLLSL